MEKNLKYLSPEWRDELEKRLREGLTADKMKGVTSSMNSRYKNCPDGKDRYYYIAFENGEISELTIGEGDGPKAEFTIAGDYEIFASVSRSEMNAQKALMSGKLKFYGNMVKALKLLSLCDRLNKITATIPTEF